MIEFIINFSIARRYVVLVCVTALAGIGVWQYHHLSIDALPDITNVQVQINTQAPGYSPLEAEQRITFPIETALYGLPQLAYTRSISRYGLSQVTVVFEEGTDIYSARSQISQRLSEIKASLPSGVEPVMGPLATGLGEIVVYTLSAHEGARLPNGNSVTAQDLREVQDWQIAPQLAQVKGVVEVNTMGGFTKQYHVLPDPQKMLAMQVTWEDLRQALRQNNSNTGAGFIENNGTQRLVRSTGQLTTLADIENLVVGQYNRSPVKVIDVAEVALGSRLRSGAATYNGNETVMGTVMMLIGENPQDVAENVTKKLDVIARSLPPWVSINTVYNRTGLVEKAITTVQKNLLEGALFVIVVLFALLGNLRAALITAAVIPFTMLITITGMVQTGVSANLMSLGALDFGLIVDGTVIIVENCIRRLALAQQGHSQPLAMTQRLHEVKAATLEVIKPSLLGIAIITAVYLPLFSLSGVEGKMFHPMALTVVMALLAAMLLSLTAVPAAIALWMTGKINTHESRFIRTTKHAYRGALMWVLHMKWLVIGGVIFAMSACLWLAKNMGTEFIPQLDEGDIALHALRITGTSLRQSVDMQRQLENQINAFEEVLLVFSKIGTPEVATDPMPPNVADTFVILRPRETWPNPDKPKATLVREIEHAVESLPGNNYEFTQPIQMRFNELISGVRADVAIKVFGDDLPTLLSTANRIATLTKNIPGAADTRVEQVDGLPVLSVVPNREKMARYGVTVTDIQSVISTSIGGEQVGLMYQGDRRFALTIQLPEHLRADIEAISALPLFLGQTFIPLHEVADIQLVNMPAQISRENGKRRVVITTNVRGTDLGSFVLALQTELAQSVSLNDGYWIEYGGTFEQLASASERLSVIVPLTLLAILLLLVMAFGSLKDALIIFSGVPFALTGGILALWFRDMPLSISAGVGFIALSGVAVLNGLVMVAFIRQLWQQNHSVRYAVVEGAIARLRPVMMTALVASLGFIPMALNTGTGAEVQRPLATVVIGGIITSTLLTLFVLPTLFEITHKHRRKNSTG